MKTTSRGSIFSMCAFAAAGVLSTSLATSADRAATPVGFHNLQTEVGVASVPYGAHGVSDPWLPSQAWFGDQGRSVLPVLDVHVVASRGAEGAACGLEFVVPESAGRKLRAGHWSAVEQRIGVRLLIDERGSGKVEARKLAASPEADAESGSTALRVFSVRAGDFGPTRPLPGWRKDRWPQGGSEYGADAGEVARIIVAAAEGRAVELNVDGRTSSRAFVGYPRLDEGSLVQLRGCFARLAAAY